MRATGCAARRLRALAWTGWVRRFFARRRLRRLRCREASVISLPHSLEFWTSVAALGTSMLPSCTTLVACIT